MSRTWQCCRGAGSAWLCRELPEELPRWEGLVVPEQVRRSLQERPRDWGDCVRWARRHWQLRYHNSIAQLLHDVPPSHVSTVPPLCPLCWRGVPSPDSAFPAAGNQPRCALLVGGQEVSPPTDVRPQQCECTEMWGRGELLVGSGHGSGQSCSRNLNGLRSMQDERRLHPPLYCRTPTWHTWRLLPTSWLTPTGCHPAVTGWPRGMCSATRCCHPSCPRMGATSPRWRAWKRWRRLWVRLLHVCVPKA